MKACFVLLVKEPARLGKSLCLHGPALWGRYGRGSLKDAHHLEQVASLCPGNKNCGVWQPRLADELSGAESVPEGVLAGGACGDSRNRTSSSACSAHQAYWLLGQTLRGQNGKF